MYMIVMTKNKHGSFSLWYLYGTDFGPSIFERWKTGSSIRSCIDIVKRTAEFSTHHGKNQTFAKQGLFPEDFDIPKEFCRKKGFEHIESFWMNLTKFVFGERIWIHRSSELK